MKIAKIIILTFFISGCMLLYRESYTLKDDGWWFSNKTGKEVSNEDYRICKDIAIYKVTGEHISIEKLLGTEKYSELRPILGKCLYEKGYIFKIKNPIVYCYNRKEECKAYKPYIRYF